MPAIARSGQRKTRAAHREEHGQRQLTGAGDRSEMGRSSAAAPAGEDVRAAWRNDLAQNHGRVDGAVREAARSALSGDEEGTVRVKSDWYGRHQREGARPQASVRPNWADLAVCR